MLAGGRQLIKPDSRWQVFLFWHTTEELAEDLDEGNGQSTVTIGGNTYHLIAKVRYPKQKILIRAI